MIRPASFSADLPPLPSPGTGLGHLDVYLPTHGAGSTTAAMAGRFVRIAASAAAVSGSIAAIVAFFAAVF